MLKRIINLKLNLTLSNFQRNFPRIINYSDSHPDSKTAIPFPIRDKGTSEPITKRLNSGSTRLNN